jgi:hypothetical protein
VKGFEELTAQRDGRLHALIGVYTKSEDFNDELNPVSTLLFDVALHNGDCEVDGGSRHRRATSTWPLRSPTSSVLTSFT